MKHKSLSGRKIKKETEERILRRVIKVINQTDKRFVNRRVLLARLEYEFLPPKKVTKVKLTKTNK